MKDKFKNHIAGLRDPIESAVNVTPNDAEDLQNITRALYIGTAGDLRVTMSDGTIVTYVVGQGWHPIRVSRVWAAGTTALNIVACC